MYSQKPFACAAREFSAAWQFLLRPTIQSRPNVSTPNHPFAVTVSTIETRAKLGFSILIISLQVRNSARRRATFSSYLDLSRALKKCAELCEVSLQACVGFFQADIVVSDELKKPNILKRKQAISKGSRVDL